MQDYLNEHVIEVGDFIIVQRQDFTKLHKIKQNGVITLGKDVVELGSAVGQKYYKTFRLVLIPGSKRRYTLDVSDATTNNSIKYEESGNDNRNIIDDGNSQNLTRTEIEELRDQVGSSSDIVQKLIDNSRTFSSKTEYSQEKYVKKKQRKYFEYIQIRKPTIRLLAQTFYRQDPAVIQGVRVDDLSQILTYANIQSDGCFLLYDSGTSGLLPAAILNSIGANTSGHLIHMHPGNECQKNAVIAMQFPKEHLGRCVHVNIYSVLRCFYQNPDSYSEEPLDLESSPKRLKLNEDVPSKRPFWQIENERACRLLQNKVNSVVVVAKEHPLNIVKELVPFLKASGSLVVFNLIREPLQDLYFYLKNRTDFIAVKLSNNFMRSYQILPERTHPEVTMNSGGFILCGYKLNV